MAGICQFVYIISNYVGLKTCYKVIWFEEIYVHINFGAKIHNRGFNCPKIRCALNLASSVHDMETGMFHDFLKMIALSKWSGYVLFLFNPLVMVHSLSIQYLSRASNVKTSPLTTSMAKNFISLILWPFEEKCWYNLGFSNISSSCTDLLCWPPLTIKHPLVFPAYWGLWLHLWHSIM